MKVATVDDFGSLDLDYNARTATYVLSTTLVDDPEPITIAAFPAEVDQLTTSVKIAALACVWAAKAATAVLESNITITTKEKS